MRGLAFVLVVACSGTPPTPPSRPADREPPPRPALEIAAPRVPTLQPPPPQPPPPTEIARGPNPSCTGACCWNLALLAPIPEIAIDQVRVRPNGAWRVVTIKNPVPNSPAKHFKEPVTEFWSAVDDDGTIVFTGHWFGNPDQANNIGNGIYRLRGDRAEPIVDPSSVMPDVKQRFNVFGIPSIERGKLVFWGGRDGGGPSGVYMAHDRKITAIAGASSAVKGSGTPSIRNGVVAFQGTEAGIPGVYRWTEQRGLERAFQIGDLGIAHLFEVSLGDGVVFAGTGMALADRRQIIAWSGGPARVLVSGDQFRDSRGTALHLQPQPVAQGKRVAFTVGAGRISEAWIADTRPDAACKLERVAASGDVVDNTQIEMVSGLAPDAFTTRGELLITVVLVDQTTRLVRATPRTKR